jgi:uncharacterized protein (TIGR00106 family)
MAVAEISIEPLGTQSPSVGELITASVEVLKSEPDLKIDVTAMGTVIEGETHRILSIAEKMQAACFKAGAERVMLTIRLDERHDKSMSMTEMAREVEQQAGVKSEKGPEGSLGISH